MTETLRVHSEAPTTPDDLFEDVMEAVDSPAFGPMEWDLSDRPEELDELSTTFEEAEELLSAELDDLIRDDDSTGASTESPAATNVRMFITESAATVAVR